MSRDYIPLVKKDETSKVFLKNIILIEQELRKSMIYTDKEKFWLYSKIDTLMQYLDSRFLKCHQSYIINLDKVVKMKSQTIFFENGQKIFIGREKFQSTRQYYASYIIHAQKNLAKSPGM